MVMVVVMMMMVVIMMMMMVINGPGPIWARAHMGSGPLGPGPFLVGRTPHQKTHPGKKSPNCVFWLFFGKQKRCGTSVRSFSTKFRAEISAMCQKTKDSVLPFFVSRKQT